MVLLHPFLAPGWSIRRGIVVAFGGLRTGTASTKNGILPELHGASGCPGGPQDPGTGLFLEELGLHAVKVLVPGLQPLHAGYRFRVRGGERLYQLPQRMGLAERLMTGGDLNPWPHPFW